jgi:hypothetical protein
VAVPCRRCSRSRNRDTLHGTSKGRCSEISRQAGELIGSRQGSHPIFHPTSDNAVGFGGMNGRRDGRQAVDFPDRKEWEITGWDGWQRITSPIYDADAAWRLALEIIVPVFRWMWSEHDIFLGHRRRYTMREVEQLISRAGLVQLRSSYFFAFVFPLAAAARLGQELSASGTDEGFGDRVYGRRPQAKTGCEAIGALLCGGCQI